MFVANRWRGVRRLLAALVVGVSTGPVAVQAGVELAPADGVVYPRSRLMD